MKDKVEFIALPSLLLLVFFFGKLALSVGGAPYEVGIQVFSMVNLQIHLALLWSAVARRYKGYGIVGAVQVGIMIALVSQLLIVFGTGLSYAIGDTHFNNPIALNQTDSVSFLTAMGIRAGGLLANCVFSGIAAVIGYALAAFVPPPKAQAA